MAHRLRARWLIGTITLTLVSGCVLLSGVDDLEVAGADGGVALLGGDGAPVNVDAQEPDGTAPENDGSATEDAARDAGIFVDADAADTSTPPKDSGTVTPPGEAGTTPTASVGCAQDKACSGQAPVCCFSALFPVGSCAATPLGCMGPSFSCDDDSDCTRGSVCCVSWSATTFVASSQCATTCAVTGGAPGGTGPACSKDAPCPSGSKCEKVTFAPPLLTACQK